jgi:hypothetical protein
MRFQENKLDSMKHENNEQILWQGRPAPRCYTFQHWKQALAGSILFLVSSFWLMLALELIKEGHPYWLALIPLPLIAGSFLFGPMQILVARWRWPKIFYQLTDKQLFLLPDKSVQLSAIIDIKMKKQGASLASFRLAVAGSKPLIIHCIEQPDQLLRLLKERCPQLKV